MAKFYKMSMSEIIESLIAKHPDIPFDQEQFNNKLTQGDNVLKNDNTNTNENPELKHNVEKKLTIYRNGIKMELVQR